MMAMGLVMRPRGRWSCECAQERVDHMTGETPGWRRLLHNHAPNAIHSALDGWAHGIPIRTPLGEFVYFFCAENAVVAIPVCDDCRYLLGVFGLDEINLCELT